MYCQYSNKFGNVVRYAQNLNRNVLDYNKNELYINDTLYNTYTGYVTPFTTPVTICLCANNNNGTKTGGLFAKIYSVKIYDDNNLEFDGVPCYRKSDNEVGMYDLVTQTFFTNSGTGSFTYGTEV